MTDRQVELHERLAMPEAVLTRTDLADLGYPRRAVDVIFKHVIREGGGVQMLPDFARPMIRVGADRLLVPHPASSALALRGRLRAAEATLAPWDITMGSTGSTGPRVT